MSSSSWTSLLALSVQAGTPALLWGPPGVGKTSRIQSLAARLGRHLEVVILSVREPTDVCGFPIVSAGQVHFAPPAWAVRLCEAGRPGILFLDEITTAPPAVQAAALRVVLDRVVGDLSLPRDTSIIAAANPPEIAAGGHDLAPPLANRFIHLFVDEGQSIQDWIDWLEGMDSEDDIPTVHAGLLEKEEKTLRTLLAQWARGAERNLLLNPRGDVPAWPSPRSWTHGCRLAAAARAAGREDLVLAALASAVGEEPAVEFLSWVKEKVPSPEEIISNPEVLTNMDPDRVHRALSALPDWVDEDPAARWSAAWSALDRISQVGIDLVIPVCRELISRHTESLISLGIPDLASRISEACGLILDDEDEG